MEAGPSERDPFLRLRRHLRQEVESGALLQPPQDGGGAAEESTALEKKEKPLPRLNIHSAFWILASIAVTYYFEFFKTVKETIQADRHKNLHSNLFQHCIMARLVISHPCVAVHSIYGSCDAYITPGLGPLRCQEVCLYKEVTNLVQL
ncbi:transmembrane protein 128 isoform A [Alligator mississippiensis]|uniref:Transmembrane protein 128 isoform A n=1 Tax=Alligator mississippiensis TaxID=8496 RepID=A0A151PAH1_ALLMI|nr:transmembrane protein 128 isoform A [Alligator mississippiensis]